MDDTKVKVKVVNKERKTPLAWKCSSDGKHFAVFPAKRCRYCVPIYELGEVNRLRKDGA